MSRSSDVRVVLVDFGHTLFDTAGSIDFIQRYAREHGSEVDRELVTARYEAMFALSRTPEELAKGRDLSPGAHRAAWLGLYGLIDEVVPGIAATLYEFETSPLGWAPFPDTRRFLEALTERDIPVVVVSDVAFDIRPIFEHHGMARFVRSFVISGEHGTVKADGELFRVALDAVGARPEEALMIGDNPANDGRAVLYGIRTVLLPLPAPGAARGLQDVLRLIT